jgi:hypothetical protein
MNVMRAVALLVIAVCAFGCGGGAPNANAPTAKDREAHWQDVFDVMPPLLVVVRPAALRRDDVYGPLLKRVSEIARMRSRAVAATRALEAFELADEVIIGVKDDDAQGPGEVIAVARGVRADIDPLRLVDADGQAVWRQATQSSSPVPELVHEESRDGARTTASLFVLPSRTWVIAVDNARDRVRESLAHPFGRPAFKVDPNAMIVVRLDGPSLVKRTRTLQDLGRLAAIGRRLLSLSLALAPGKSGIVTATLTYADEDAAALSEVSVRQVAEVLPRAKPERFGWLSSTQVDRMDRRVTVQAPLPPKLIEALVHADAAPIEDADVPQQ